MGYIENRGRGIQQIFNACKANGEEVPMYELLGKVLRVYSKTLKSALEVSKDHFGTLNGTLDGTLAENVKVKIENREISRTGSKRYGHWKVKE